MQLTSWLNRYQIILAALICAVAAVALWPAFHSPAIPMDEGMVLVYPEMILKGHLPYRDFEHVTGPGNHLLLAAVYQVFGVNIFAERAVGLIYRLIIVAAIFGITRRWDRMAAGACAFIAAVLLTGTDLWANTWFAGVAFALCSLWASAKYFSPARCFTGGFCAGLAALCRCDFGPALLLSLLPMFWPMRRDHKIKFLIGGFIALLPLLVLTIIIGPAQIWHSLFVFPVFELNPGRRLSIFSARPELIVLLVFQFAAGLINVSAGVVEVRTRETRERGRLLLAVAILGLSFLHYALERFDSGHALNASLVSLSLLPLSILVLLSAALKNFPARKMAVIAALIPITAIHLMLPTFARYFYRGLRVQLGISSARQASHTGEELEPGDKGVFVIHNGRPFAFGFSYAAEDAVKLLTELERVSLPGQRLFVGPGDLRLTNYCDTYIYYLEPQLTPATYFLEMNPGSANAAGSRLAADIATADWIILNRRYDFLNESNTSIRFGSAEPIRVVHEQFDFWWETGSYLMFRNKKLANSILAPPP